MSNPSLNVTTHLASHVAYVSSQIVQTSPLITIDCVVCHLLRSILFLASEFFQNVPEVRRHLLVVVNTKQVVASAGEPYLTTPTTGLFRIHAQHGRKQAAT